VYVLRRPIFFSAKVTVIFAALAHQFGVWQKNVLTLANDPRRIGQAALAMHARRMTTARRRRADDGSSAGSTDEHRARVRRRRARRSSPESTTDSQ